MRKTLFAGLLLASTAFSATAIAMPIVPVGPQNDVAFDTVVNDWGWTLHYRGDYSEFDVDVAGILAGTGDLIMLAGIRDGSATIDVLAATTTVDATTVTARNATTTSNGAEWYFNDRSWGFAGLGDSIIQNPADVTGTSERDRLSWHAGGSSAGFDVGLGGVAPIQIDGGWRSGSNTGLNGNSGWDKLIFTASSKPLQAVPEPGSLALVGVALLGVAIRRRTR